MAPVLIGIRVIQVRSSKLLAVSGLKAITFPISAVSTSLEHEVASFAASPLLTSRACMVTAPSCPSLCTPYAGASQRLDPALSMVEPAVYFDLRQEACRRQDRPRNDSLRQNEADTIALATLPSCPTRLCRLATYLHLDISPRMMHFVAAITSASAVIASLAESRCC